MKKCLPIIVLGLLSPICFMSYRFKTEQVQGARPPNIILVLMDDLGYGDLGCYGGSPYQTPHINNLAAEGMRFTSFYSAQATCTAARSAFLTGCYPNRIGISGA